ncbi:MAG TPA: tRNA preQ1(34) S-adenosylmethionine ribosyltransferase-isomerase QueA [Planctomycetaceae bacterium]|nr:tRNA preQ1(34) S-adenosylmethionine ribosyltransferase-isomerase QueA [Planctomycetaceae bacterium]
MWIFEGGHRDLSQAILTSPSSMHDPDACVSAYDYELPDGLIAAEPLPERDAARMLVVHRATQRFEHRLVRDLPEFLRPGDCLVLNDTRVIPARLFGRRTATGGKWEGLFLGVTPDGEWQFIGQTRGRLQPGESITLHTPAEAGSGEEFELRLVACGAEGLWTARPAKDSDPLDVLARFGSVPLPPYIEASRSLRASDPRAALASADDWTRYQTIFARRPGAVAAPTAGLHFTPELLERCGQAGISHAFVTLHVGLGTFRPIAAERLDDHRMHAEWCEIPVETAERLNQTRRAGGRVVAVGTTAVRTLESFARGDGGTFQPGSGRTDLFLRPPYAFPAVDALLTNFHLPRSTLLVLVSAFAGRELILRAYREAVDQRYRFYSYGDATMIV